MHPPAQADGPTIRSAERDVAGVPLSTMSCMWRKRRISPLGAVARGLAAGMAGTVVMTGYQVGLAKAARQRAQHDTSGGGQAHHRRCASLVELPAMKLSPPPWEQPPAELALDASYHLVYGMAVAAAYRLLDRR